MRLSTGKVAALEERTRHLVSTRLSAVAARFAKAVPADLLVPGKMLRTRLAARLAGCSASPPAAPVLENLCGATEIIHTASLCHDDLIDNAQMRRGRPSLWRTVGVPGALLMGDLLFCDAIDLVLHTKGGGHFPAFMAKVAEVVGAEAEQELLFREKELPEAACLRLARGKTGPLFAFVSCLCGGQDESLCRALEMAGYDVGTAYQLADDLLDVLGDEQDVGKTLRTDGLRGKITLAQNGVPGRQTARDHVRRLCASALERLRFCPEAHEGLAAFLECDFQPALSRLDRNLTEERITP
jgi:geranylgeranyl pyrophosphate synthase